MKVLVGHFTTESNENIPQMNTIKNYELETGEKVIDRMKIREVFKSHNIEIIPSVYAGGGPSGVIEKNTFLLIENMFLNSIQQHLNEIDGIYLWLHGASYVEKLGSGDFHLLKEIRKLVGPYLPIAISCDPHGNLSKEYVSEVQIIRSFRNSPHTDMVETYQRVASMLCDLLENRQYIHPEYIKLPLILGGEQSVSTDEPVKSINIFMDEMEKDNRIRSASWHVGYLRHDCPEAGCGITVIPEKEADQEYAKEKASELASYVWSKHKEFHYTGITADVDQSIKMALESNGKPFIITDSGDNTTSGATGCNTYLLRRFKEIQQLNKSVLFASIVDSNTFNKLSKYEIGEIVNVNLGMNYDDLTRTVNLNLKIINFGDVIRVAALGKSDYTKMGEAAHVQVVGSKIDIIISNHRQSYCHNLQFDKIGLSNWKDYDIVIVKQGYIFPELKEACNGYVMALTDGSTPQDTKNIKFKLIQRPIYPIDDI